MSERRVWTLGEGLAVLVSESPGPAEHANELRVGVGGAEVNLAIGLARLGHRVTWVGVVGDDPWGRRVGRELRAEGVEAHVRIDPFAFTGAYLRERRTEAMARATYLRRGSAGSHLEPDDVKDLDFQPGDVVHLSGVTAALSETAFNAWVTAAHRAREAGAHVNLDVNYRSALTTPDASREAFDQISTTISTVMASTDEAEVVTGRAAKDPREAALALREVLGAEADIVIKNGAAGSLHLASDDSVTTGAALPVTICDIVGAGDAFAAGYLSGLIDNLAVPQRLARAHACAAFVIASRGDWEGAPRRSELGLASALADLEVHR
jgi:2-dehydro-3-deoxygluconokinase